MTTCKVRLCMSIATVCWGLAISNRSFANTVNTNIREQCRIRVSGSYLSIWNKLTNSKDLLTLTKKSIEQTQIAISENKKKLKIILSSKARKDFDYKTAEKENTSKALIKSLEFSLEEESKLLRKAEATYKSTQIQEQRLKKKILKLFTINKIMVGKEASSFDIQYKTACPKFRYVCPLTRPQAQNLIAVFEKDKIPTSCRRYSGHFDY